MDRGLAGGPGWTPEQYAAAVLAILDSPYHAVPCIDLAEQLGCGSAGGAAALAAMVHAHVLALRPASNLAEDIPEEAYEGYASVITSRSPL